MRLLKCKCKKKLKIEIEIETEMKNDIGKERWLTF